MSAPRVLVSGVVLGQPAGGVRRHNAELLPRVAALLAEAGGSLAVLEGREKIPFALPDRVERIASTVPPRPALIRAAFEGRALRATIARAARAGRPFDLVHTAHLPVPRALPLPYTLTIHDLRSLEPEHAHPSRRLVAKSVTAAAVERATFVMTVSESVRRELIARFEVDPARVRVVPNAADHFEPLARRPGADAAILCVGHLEPRKNLALVVHAIARSPHLPRLVLAGAAKGEEEARLRTLAAELGVAERVTFFGAFDDRDLPRLYAEAACVIVPSKVEGFGIVALEAQRARVPLAIARIEPLREVAGDAVPSFAPDDELECARAIERALAATEDDRSRGERNAARWSWKSSAQRWFEVWCDAL